MRYETKAGRFNNRGNGGDRIVIWKCENCGHASQPTYSDLFDHVLPFQENEQRLYPDGRGYRKVTDFLADAYKLGKEAAMIRHQLMRPEDSKYWQEKLL